MTFDLLGLLSTLSIPVVMVGVAWLLVARASRGAMDTVCALLQAAEDRGRLKGTRSGLPFELERDRFPPSLVPVWRIRFPTVRTVDLLVLGRKKARPAPGGRFQIVPSGDDAFDREHLALGVGATDAQPLLRDLECRRALSAVQTRPPGGQDRFDWLQFGDGLTAELSLQTPGAITALVDQVAAVAVAASRLPPPNAAPARLPRDFLHPRGTFVQTLLVPAAFLVTNWITVLSYSLTGTFLVDWRTSLLSFAALFAALAALVLLWQRFGLRRYPSAQRFHAVVFGSAVLVAVLVPQPVILLNGLSRGAERREVVRVKQSEEMGYMWLRTKTLDTVELGRLPVPMADWGQPLRREGRAEAEQERVEVVWAEGLLGLPRALRVRAVPSGYHE